MAENVNGSPPQNGKRRFNLDLTMGPAFFAVLLQTVLALIAGAYIAGQITNTAENTKATADRLTQIVDRTNQRTDGINDRLIKVETLLDGLNRAVTAIGEKIDRSSKQR